MQTHKMATLSQINVPSYKLSMTPTENPKPDIQSIAATDRQLDDTDIPMTTMIGICAAMVLFLIGLIFASVVHYSPVRSSSEKRTDQLGGSGAPTGALTPT